MPKYITVLEKVERKTYLKGKFRGKYVGVLDDKKSDGIHENFYDLEVLTGQISCRKEDIRKWQEGDEFNEFRTIGKCLTKLPAQLPCEIEGNDQVINHYLLRLHQPKLINYSLSLQQYDQEKVFGVVEGEISGFLIHYDDREIEVEEEDPDCIDNNDYNDVSRRNIANITDTHTEKKGNYTRPIKEYSDGTLRRGNWQRATNESSRISLWDVIGYLIFAFFILLPAIVLLINFFWPVVFIAGLFLIFNYLQPLLSFLGKWLIRLLGLTFILLFFGGLITLFKETSLSTVRQHAEDPVEVTQLEPNPKGGSDSIISHLRIWKDYDQKEYSGYFRIKVSDYRKAGSYRQNLSMNMSSPDEYNKIVSVINKFESKNLNLLFPLFDSIRSSNQLSKQRFAEVITSSVQDIPYSLILDRDCNPSFYNDAFITQYLKTGGECTGNVKYGLFSPSEFIGSLKGNCDTRTLLLFTILEHYGYDVVMLSSEVYRHSIIGINLPYEGIAKTINGKRYVVWETTLKGMKPGVVSPSQSDMRYWSASIFSKIQTQAI